MCTDLYVDSEHGFGIGRLGKRVKDGSIIWTVHLDSGEVYLVYAFYKVKRWAYMPKDEKTNTKLKYELMLNKDRSYVPCYLKSEADAFIAAKDAKIIQLTALIENYNRISGEIIDNANHQKYKRCLAMADFCESQSDYFHSVGNGFWLVRGNTEKRDEYRKKVEDFWWKWRKRWIELAEKFKHNNWAYSNGYTEEWGCVLFGKECEKCKKFDSDVGGCFYSQKKLERLAYEFNKRCRHAQKISEGYTPFFKKPKTEKTPIFRPHFGFSYKVVGHETWFCKNYMPNRKGGHRHNHARNVLERKLNKSKSSRKRCHNHLNKGFNYKFIDGRGLRRVK